MERVGAKTRSVETECDTGSVIATMYGPDQDSEREDEDEIDEMKMIQHGVFSCRDMPHAYLNPSN